MNGESMTDERAASLTPAMKRLLIGAAVIVALGIAITIWLLTAGGASPGAEDRPGGTTSSSAPTNAAGPSPGATAEAGSEVGLPTQAPYVLPTSEPAGPLVPPPFPASAAADGEIVAGFPEAVMGPVPGSDVLHTEISTENEVMQVALVARTGASEEDVRQHYTSQWTALGLTPSDAQPDGSLSFTGSSGSLTLAFPTSGTGTGYTVFGVFRAS
jgi:hypothetical protein